MYLLQKRTQHGCHEIRRTEMLQLPVGTTNRRPERGDDDGLPGFVGAVLQLFGARLAATQRLPLPKGLCPGVMILDPVQQDFPADLAPPVSHGQLRQ